MFFKKSRENLLNAYGKNFEARDPYTAHEYNIHSQLDHITLCCAYCDVCNRVLAYET